MNTVRLNDTDGMLAYQLKATGWRTKILRIGKGWSVEDLAFYSKLNRQSIYNIEAGEGNLTFRSLVCIANALEVKPIDLMG